ncbi:unnamed protein product [Brassica rapa]|uniref:Reverse transcriptase zinc-binding domain-containing protein n=1 Tax=Brassica campestris TaxID=3711 RepID=A0A3P5XY07_BRACM|nr:unnamed protein product [Brassica rapa]VDC59676.1 unnamed protein product [Brassica rapa]
MQVTLSCCLCNSLVENTDHVFLRCKWTEELWGMVLHRLGIRQIAFHTWRAFSEWLNMRNSHSSRLLKRLVSPNNSLDREEQKVSRRQQHLSSSSLEDNRPPSPRYHPGSSAPTEIQRP